MQKVCLFFYRVCLSYVDNFEKVSSYCKNINKRQDVCSWVKLKNLAQVFLKGAYFKKTCFLEENCADINLFQLFK